MYRYVTVHVCTWVHIHKYMYVYVCLSELYNIHTKICILRFFRKNYSIHTFLADFQLRIILKG